MSAPDALFDLAMNRAAAFLRSARPVEPGAALAEWHARTRFARRVPLEEVMLRLQHKPQGEWYWTGGPAGKWQPGKAKFP
ncbi:hypothetical protein [Deinococcus peraridilitoris]|uniref:Uncharacterized protein n=1 Tax=Deinococcus peraridilitoris (strain DSM 19664 / LMG 22246 / CIP 109416 / KR-200) TaxID=937777 RepID=K9ZY25_DEIPD|nr:hypothetical protein [Deinococcus peraridilitoris]AFZ65832.1 hypothetical protein Deipe_0230 [Deinococcus peraridilitoris DSM 19664]